MLNKVSLLNKVRNANCVGFSNDNISADSTFKFLFKSDIPLDINQTNSKGCSLLMLAGLHGLSVYQDLLKRGADAKALDHKGNTVLHCYFARLSSNIDSVDFVLEGPAIVKTLILAGANYRHVNCHGQLPHEVFKTGPGLTTSAYIHLALANCILYEALRRTDIDPAGIFIESSSKLQTYTDESPLCCFYQWRSSSLEQDRIHLESLAFEDQIIAVLECWIITQKKMNPFLPRFWKAWNTCRVEELMESLCEFKSKRTKIDRAASNGVGRCWEEPYSQSKMELHQSSKQQNSWQDCDGVTSDGNTANIDLPELCERCQRNIRKEWEDRKMWEEREFGVLWEAHEIWAILNILSEEEPNWDTQSEEHMDMDAGSEEETDSDTTSEENYFSAEEA